MLRYTLKRLLFLIPSVLIVTGLTFVILSLTPGSPGQAKFGMTGSQEEIEAFNESVGWNEPLGERYLEYLANALHGDFGTSYTQGQTVYQILAPKFPTTLTVALWAVVVSAALGIPLGVLAAVRKGSAWDTATTVVSLVLASIPSFFLGLLLMLVFALRLGWLPTFGIGTWRHYVLPVLTLGLPSAAYVARLVRIQMLAELESDYARTARAKGASQLRIVFVHALRNALLPVITTLGMSFAGLLGGAIIAEQVFGLPGFGSAILTAINTKDTPVVMGATTFLSLVYMLIMLALDLINALLNPKIREDLG